MGKVCEYIWYFCFHQEISADAKMFTEGADSADVSQGRVGNCWFVAAAGSLALEKDLWTKASIHNHFFILLLLF